MAMPSLSRLTLSGLLYPLHCVEGVLRAAVSWELGKSGPRLWSALTGLIAAGAAALFLLRTMAVPPGPAVALSAYLVGGAVTIALYVILAALFERSGDAT